MRGREGYVPLRRGILDHLPRLKGSAITVYIALIGLADFHKGHEGEVRGYSIMDLCRVTGLSRPVVGKVLYELAEPVYPERGDEGYILYEPGVNEHKPMFVKVCKYPRSDEFRA